VRLGRIAFLGTDPFAVPLLARLADLADELLVVTQPDRPAGRRLEPRPSAVAAFARQGGLRVETPTRLRSPEAVAGVRAFAPDGLVCVAYGQLVPAALLDAFPRPPLNVHPSLLPRHRGAAPVAATIRAGDAEGGVTLMVMTERLDAGPIVEQWRVPLGGRESTPRLERQLAELAATVVPPVLVRWAAGELRSVPQEDDAATLTHPFTREDGRIAWDDAAHAIDRQVRALQPWPGAWTLAGGRRLHVRAARPAPAEEGLPPGTLLGPEPRVACASGSLVLELVQPEGRGIMPGADWRRGAGRGLDRLGEEAGEGS
jgi:methionyl-tRNA formyltransferase